MKIGILTLPLHTNYGGILQAYALQTVLQNEGHEVFVVEKRYKRPVWLSLLVYIKRACRKYILRRNIEIFQEINRKRIEPILRQNTNKFIEKYINRLFVEEYIDLLDKHSLEAIIVGSDQIWRPKYFGDIKYAFLSFCENNTLKRIAYAPSFGTSDWEYSEQETIVCKKYIKKFDVITVREKSGIKLCENYFNVVANHVLDPTMLLDKNHYNGLIKGHEKNNKGKILSYILDQTQETDSLIDKVSGYFNKVVFSVGSKVEQGDAELSERINKSVEDWIAGFDDADMVLTDSFHACVFSIIYNKPFLVVANESRGEARIDSLLELFGLQYLKVKPTMIIDESNFNSYIDWGFIKIELEKFKNESLQLLFGSLH